MGSTYRLHRLILSRSSYFRNMLYGPWKEAAAPKFVLQTDDPYVNSEAITMALKYIYGYYPKLNDDNAFQVLAAASFLDLQDLCVICTDFIISELCTSDFLAYQVFAESQEYDIYGERVRNACWRYLCQCGTIELKEEIQEEQAPAQMEARDAVARPGLGLSAAAGRAPVSKPPHIPTLHIYPGQSEELYRLSGVRPCGCIDCFIYAKREAKKNNM